MFSIQKFFSKDERFYDLLEASAEEACGSVRALIRLLHEPGQARAMDVFVQSRRKEKRITEEISEELCKTFITPIEREDIEALANALYKIPKTVEKFGERYLIAPAHLQNKYFAQHAALLEKATGTLLLMVKELRSKPRLDLVRSQKEEMHYLEGEADRLMVEMLRGLYKGEHSAMDAVILRDLIELIEKVVDRCRDASNVVFRIVLKYS